MMSLLARTRMMWWKDTLSSKLQKSTLKNYKGIIALSDQDLRVAEEVIVVRKPLKTVTTLMTTMILCLKTKVLKSMENNEEGSPTVIEVKAAASRNLMDKDLDPVLQDFLHKSEVHGPSSIG